MDVNELDDAALDRLLDKVAPPAVTPALERRILGDFDRVRMHANNQVEQSRWSFTRLVRRFGDAVWPGGPVWQPAGAFAVALVIGLGVAVFAPFDIAQQDDATANVFALDGSPDVDAGQGI